MLEQMLSELGGLWLSRIQQFWDSKRNIRVMNSDYQVAFDVVDKSDLDGDFDVVVVAGSTMAVNKTARLQQLIQMAQTPGEDGMPLVDRQTVLENADLPNLEEILQRFAQIKQQQAEEAATQQQAQAEMQMQQQQMAQQQEMAKAEQQASQQLDMEEIKHMEEKEKMTLQQQLQPVQSKEGEQNSEQEALMQIIQIIAAMSPEELMKQAENNPQIAQILEMLSQLPDTEQSQKGTQKEEKK
jgi:hypothetical protein